MKNSIERMQRRACSGFAERKNFEQSTKAKLLSLLTLLLMATGSAWAQNDGALNGKFTINASGDKVYFAQGNLQAVCTSADGNAATPEDFTWRFADHQWDYIGGNYDGGSVPETANNHIDGNGSVSAAGTVDLFSWVGASSTLTGTAAYGLTNMWGNGYEWGNGNVANEGLKSDWGNLFGDGWFTLSGDEWAYLLNTRSTTSGVRFAKAFVNSVPGIIVLPDDWSTSYYALNSANTASVGFDANAISSDDWISSLEAHDAVFLPIAGLRSFGNIWNIGGQGFYWTSTSAADVNCACALTFHATAVEPKWSDGVYRGYGMSVRLVKDALKVTGVTLSQTEAALIVGETLALAPTVAPADAKDKSVTWTTSDASVATVSGGVVTAQGAGTATITVTTTDGAKTATCTVSVTPVTPIAATSAVGTKGFFTDANGQTRLGIVVMLGGEKYAIALSNETDLTGLSGTYTKKVGDYTYYNFADACAKFANNQTDGSYTASNVWRLPTAAEFTALANLGGSWNGTGYTWTIGGNSLFLPAAGYNDAYPVSGIGYYWSSTQPQFLYFNDGSIFMPNGGTQTGMPLRLFCRLPEIIETGYAGRVIAADGKMYKTVAAANKFSTASGIVAYYGSNAVETGQTYQGIAISLSNLRYNPDYMLYCGQGESCSGSTYGDFATAITTKNGIATTATVNANNSAHGSSHQVTAVASCNASPRPEGASAWSVPSLGQWNLIVKGLTDNGSDLSTSANAAFSTSNINAKIPMGADAFTETLYWSCTENDNANMWVMQFNSSGGWVSSSAKLYWNYSLCRAMFAFTSATSAYVVNYDANGGSGAPDEQVKDGGSSLTLSSTVPTREGYTFAGWNTAADGSGTEYEAGAEYTTEDDATLYAQWTEKKTKILDEAATDNLAWLTENDGQVYDVTLTRTLQTGGWNTFCAPFSTATPTGWTVKKLDDSAFDNTTGELTLTFGAAESIEAGKPYLVKVTATVENPTFEGVTVSSTTTTTETTAVDFVPVMNPMSLTGGDKTVLFVTGGNKLTYPTADGNINAFRAYFQLKGDAVAEARAFRMSFDDETTGIVTVLSDEPTTASGIYTLDGRRLQGQPAAKGVYIVNGKKTIIK